MNRLEEVLNTPDDRDIGNFVEVVLNYPDKIKETTKRFPLCPESKKNNPDKHND